MADGAGASQFGGDQTLPGAFSVLRKNWQEARAMLVPPEKNSASIHLDAQAVADEPCRDLDRHRYFRQSKHVDRQTRRDEIVRAVARFDLEGEQADDDAAVQRIRIPGSVRDRVGNEGVAVFGEEGLIFHGGGT